MIERSRGFTVLEVLMVVMLLGFVARMVVGVLPEQKAQDPLLLLKESAGWAWQQAQQEGRIWQIQLAARSWQLFTLTGQPTSLPGPLPDTYWQPVTGVMAQGTITEGEFYSDVGSSLPAVLWFLPDGSISQQSVIYRGTNGDEKRLALDETQLSLATP